MSLISTSQSYYVFENQLIENLIFKKRIPSTIAWLQTYINYNMTSPYNTTYLLYKNIGLLLNRLNKNNDKPNLVKHYQRIKVFKCYTVW